METKLELETEPQPLDDSHLVAGAVTITVGLVVDSMPQLNQELHVADALSLGPVWRLFPLSHFGHDILDMSNVQWR
ncbi:hypothetical protein ACLKA6_010021 [Drosophila palustris]